MRFCQILLGSWRCHKVLPRFCNVSKDWTMPPKKSSIWLCKVLQVLEGSTTFCKVLQGSGGFCQVLQGSLRFYQVLWGSPRLKKSPGLEQVLQGSKRCSKVLERLWVVRYDALRWAECRSSSLKFSKNIYGSLIFSNFLSGCLKFCETVVGSLKLFGFSMARKVLSWSLI